MKLIGYLRHNDNERYEIYSEGEDLFYKCLMKGAGNKVHPWGVKSFEMMEWVDRSSYTYIPFVDDFEGNV